VSALKCTENSGKKVQTEQADKIHLSNQSKASGQPKEAAVPRAKGCPPGQTSFTLLTRARISAEREANSQTSPTQPPCPVLSVQSCMEGKAVCSESFGSEALKKKKENSDTVTDTDTQKPLCARAREPAEISPAVCSSRTRLGWN